MQETFDRTPDGDANVLYANAGTYSLEIGKDGAYAYAGVAEAHVAAGDFSAQARFLHAGAQADISARGFGAMATAELASACARVGPVEVKVGLAADTGVKLGKDGVAVKVLGTGISLGSENSVTILGSGVSCAIM